MGLRVLCHSYPVQAPALPAKRPAARHKASLLPPIGYASAHRRQRTAVAAQIPTRHPAHNPEPEPSASTQTLPETGAHKLAGHTLEQQLLVDAGGRNNRSSSNDINYHFETCISLRHTRNIINKSTRNPRNTWPAASYERFLFLMLRINLLQKFYLLRVYP